MMKIQILKYFSRDNRNLHAHFGLNRLSNLFDDVCVSMITLLCGAGSDVKIVKH